MSGAGEGGTWFHGPEYRICDNEKCCPPVKLYPLIVRSTQDPDRSERPADGGRRDKTPHRTLGKSARGDWYQKIGELLEDGAPRTMNAISVEILDLTADITAWTPFGGAILDLVADGALEMTLYAPIQFRVREQEEKRDGDGDVRALQGEAEAGQILLPGLLPSGAE